MTELAISLMLGSMSVNFTLSTRWLALAACKPMQSCGQTDINVGAPH